MPNLPKESKCTGCLACKDTCKRNAISVIIKDGHIFPFVDKNLCIECGLCVKSCPEQNPRNTNCYRSPKVFGGWCKDNSVRKASASGGAFSALALNILRKGGIAIGASLCEDGNVKHRIISKEEELPLLQKSKYIQSDASGVYCETRDLLKGGKFVLFSGTPCQVAGLNSFLKKDFDNLVTVDVVCNGVPSKEAVELFVKKNNVKKILSYRSKDFGWHDIFSQGITWNNHEGKVISPIRSRDLFYKIFSCGLTHRQSCCNCKFSTMPRYADITIADFWGIKRFEEEWQDGISLIITNNEKGEKFIRECSELHLFDSSMNECLAANPRLVNGKKFHGWHPAMKYRKQVRRIVGEKSYLGIITNKYPWKLIWGVLKVLTIISNKYAIKKALK